MARPSPDDDFLLIVSKHLDSLSAGQLRAGIVHLVAAGTTDDPTVRRAFALPRPTPLDAPSDRSVADRVDDFVARAESGAFAEDDGWDGSDDHYPDDHFDDDEREWESELADLIKAVDRLYTAGDLEAAGPAYGKLLTTLDDDELWDDYHGPPDVDTARMKVRHLRALYEITDFDQRADTLLDAVIELKHIGVGRVGEPDPTTLAAIIKARRNKLRDLQDFLPRWIAALRAQPDPHFTNRRDQYLIEAAELSDDDSVLADMARTDGPRNPAFWLAWLDALAAAGDRAALETATDEALAGIDQPGPRAELYERLAAAVPPELRAAEVLPYRVQAFRTQPSYARLCLIAEATTDDAELTAALESDDVATAAADVNLTAIRLLATGRFDDAAELLDLDPSIRWTRAEHPGGIVVPYLLASTAPEWPLAAKRSLLNEWVGRLEQRLLRPFGPPLPHFVWAGGDRHPLEPSAKEGATKVVARLRSALAADVGALDARVAKVRLATACVALDDEVHAIVTAKDRSAYEPAAELVVAGAEVIASNGSPGPARQRVADVRGRYPRHTAFTSALDKARKRSPLLAGR